MPDIHTTTILIGNAVSLAGEVCGILSGIHKTRTLHWQTARLLVSGASNVILGSWLAFWLNLTGIGRNALLHKAALHMLESTALQPKPARTRKVQAGFFMGVHREPPVAQRKACCYTDIVPLLH